jgi:Outer membrane protein beta-barrel domain
VLRVIGIFTIAIFCAIAANAQVPTAGNAFVGYSYVNANFDSNGHSNLNGWNGSLEGKVFPFIGIVADIGAVYGSETIPTGACPVIGVPCTVNGNVDSSVRSYLFGPRVSVSVGRVRPFAEVLFGGSHIRENNSFFSNSDTSFATAIGGGIDYRLISLVGWRVEGDLLQTRFFSGTQNNFRLSTGLVLRF